MDPVDTRIDLDPGKRPNGMDLSHWCMLSVILLTKYGENRLITVWEIMLEDIVKMLYRIMYVEKLPYPHPDSDQFQNLTNALFEDHPTPIPTKFRWHLADRRTHRHTNTHTVITVHTLPRAQVQTLKGGLPGRSPLLIVVNTDDNIQLHGRCRRVRTRMIISWWRLNNLSSIWLYCGP